MQGCMGSHYSSMCTFEGSHGGRDADAGDAEGVGPSGVGALECRKERLLQCLAGRRGAVLGQPGTERSRKGDWLALYSPPEGLVRMVRGGGSPVGWSMSEVMEGGTELSM